MRDEGCLYALAVDAERLDIWIIRRAFGDDLQRLLDIGKIDLDTVEKWSGWQQKYGQW